MFDTLKKYGCVSLRILLLKLLNMLKGMQAGFCVSCVAKAFLRYYDFPDIAISWQARERIFVFYRQKVR
mgnify:FL=1